MNVHRIALLAMVITTLSACASQGSKDENVSSFKNIAGVWHFITDTPQGRFEATMFVVQTGNDINGRLESEVGDVNYTGSIDIDRVRFEHPVGNGANRFVYTGTLDANGMSGKAAFGPMGEGTWVASRVTNQ
jgi:hypothetical protein